MESAEEEINAEEDVPQVETVECALCSMTECCPIHCCDVIK
jgi:hypothetical protein